MKSRLMTVVCAALCLFAARAEAAVPTSITVQGRLTDLAGAPLPAGAKTFTFRIVDDSVGGTEVWPGGGGEVQSITSDAAGLWIGLLGAINPLTDVVFSDNLLWLEIDVNGTTLPTTQLLTSPYTFRVSTVDGASGGTITSKVSIGPGHTNTGTNAFVVGSGNEVSGELSAVGGGSVNGARGDNSVVSGGVNNWATGDHSAIGGGHSNSADSAFAVVGGGGENSAAGRHSTVGGGSLNEASGRASVVVGGERNRARGDRSFVGAGGGPNDFDTNSALGNRSAIIAGVGNIVSGDNAFIGAGSSNSINGPATNSSCIVAGQGNDVNGLCAIVVGGRTNKAKGDMSFVGGGGQPNAVPGDSNVASGIASAIVCGIGNDASDSCSFVGAGRDNTASGRFATVAGGLLNTAAGDYALAAGRRAKANHSGTFVWGDGTNADFASTTQDQFLIRASGGVGIGTNDPEAPLHILETSAGTVTANGNSIMVLERSAGGWISLVSAEASQRGILFSEPTTGIAGGIVFDANNANDLSFRTGGNTTRMTLDASGNLNVTGNITATGTCCVSDLRFKKNITTLSDPLDRVLRLRGVEYDWRCDEFPTREFSHGEQVGLIAQEVQKVVPQVVVEQSDGYLAVDYTRLVPLLIEGIKEQQKRIEKLEATIKSMTP